MRDHCHIFGKYRGSAHRDCNINVKLSHKIPFQISQPKKLGLTSSYARTRKIQS